MEKELLRSCPVCGSQKGDVLYRVDFAPVENEALPASFDVCLCSKCLFCFDDLNAT